MRVSSNKFLKELSLLIGSHLDDIFYQPVAGIMPTFPDDIMVLKFSNKICINVSCSIKITHKNKYFLTEIDVYYNKNRKYMTTGKSFTESLMTLNIEKTKVVLKDVKVKSVALQENGNLKIQFENNVKIEITPDCICDGYEFYRLLNYQLDKTVVVRSNRGFITYSDL